MFSTDENSRITDEDIEYFNNNLQNIEDVDNLISQLEAEYTKELYDTFSFLSSIENSNQPIDSLSDQMSRISESSELINNPENSPFSPIIKYCNDNKSVYGYYKRMCDAKTQINYLQGLEVNNIDSANQFITNTLSYPDPFLNWANTSDITPNKFCKSLRIASNYLARNKFANSSNLDDEKIQYTKQVLENFKSRIIECPVYHDDQYVFIPFAFFGSYLLDPDNDQLLLEYFNSFTKKYYEYLLLKLYRMNKNTIPLKEFYKSNKHSETIKLFKPLILDKLKKFIIYNINLENKCEKIVNIIIEGLISQLIHNTQFPVAHHIDYHSFTGSTLDDLLQYETNYLINKVKNHLERIKKENLNTFINKTFYFLIKDVHNELKDDLKAKFKELFDSIINSKKNPDKYKQLVFLSDIICIYNNDFNYSFYYYGDEINRFAEERGRKSMPFKSNLQEIINVSNETEIEEVKKAFGDFLQDFLMYEPNSPLTANQYNYTYKFTHGFLVSFCTIWKANIKNLSSDIIEECRHKYLYCLYKGLKLYGNSIDDSESLYDRYKPVILEGEADIYSENDYTLIDKNINIRGINGFKKICYSDLKEILNTNKQ